MKSKGKGGGGGGGGGFVDDFKGGLSVMIVLHNCDNILIDSSRLHHRLV